MNPKNANSMDPDRTTPLEIVWSEFLLFAKTYKILSEKRKLGNVTTQKCPKYKANKLVILILPVFSYSQMTN